MAGTSKASRDSSALDDFVVAGATAGSSHGRDDKTGWVTCSQSSCLCSKAGVFRRDRHRWPETLSSLVAPLPLEQAQWMVLLWGNSWLCRRLYNRVACPWCPAGWWCPASSRCVPPGPSRGLGRSFEPQILKLPWADKELAVFRHDCTLLSLLASC